jgi:hypothetical protein
VDFGAPTYPLAFSEPAAHNDLVLGATGFDGIVEAPVARRGILVGLVKNPGNDSTANEELALAA